MCTLCPYDITQHSWYFHWEWMTQNANVTTVWYSTHLRWILVRVRALASHVFPPELPRSNWELSAGAGDGCDACRAEKPGQDREHRPVSHWCPLPRGHILVSTTSLGHPWGVECGAVALRRINLTNKLESWVRGHVSLYEAGDYERMEPEQNAFDT